MALVKKPKPEQWRELIYVTPKKKEARTVHSDTRDTWTRYMDNLSDFKRKATRFCINTARAVAALVRK